ncbi:hypothetical protein [Gordonia caeni]
MDDFDLTQAIGDRFRQLAADQLSRDAEEEVPDDVAARLARILAAPTVYPPETVATYADHDTPPGNPKPPEQA